MKRMKKVISLLAVLVMVLGLVIPANASENNSSVSGLSGEGTEASPYLINNLAELKWFRDDVNTCRQDGTSQYRGKYIKLTADIDLDEDGDGVGEEWEPIGSVTKDHGSFYGVFDGAGHTISNLVVSKYGKGSGFFAKTSGSGDGPSSTIKNINFHNIDIYANGSHIGGVVGNSGGCTTVENVHVTGDVYIQGTGGYVGGVVGHGYPKVNNCSVKANEGSYVITQYWAVGGIVGYAGSEAGASITNCAVENLEIHSAYYGAGALVGVGTEGPIKNIVAKSVKIVANSEPDANGLLVGCNYGEITGNSYAENTTLIVGDEVVDAVQDVTAKVDETCYVLLATAVEYAKAGSTITILNDIELPTGIVVNKELVLELNGKTLTATKDTVGEGVFHVVKDGTLTINNDGTVDGKGANEYSKALLADGGTIIINGGTYTNVDCGTDERYDLIYAKDGGTVIINGGTFECQTPNWTLNRQDKASDTIIVKGGEFVGYDPSHSATEDPVVNFVATGYSVTENDDVYVVECKHFNMIDMNDGKAQTCTEPGLTSSEKCSVCGLISSQSVIEPDGHKKVVDKAVAATCTKTGLTEGSHCSVCKEVFKAQEEVKASGHKFVDGVCGACGLSIKVEAEVTDTVPTKPAEGGASSSTTGTTEKVEVPEVKEVTIVETTESKKAETSVKAEATEIVATTITEGTDKLVEDKVIDKETAANLEAVTAVMNGDADAVEKAVEAGLLTKEEVKVINEAVAKGETVVKAEISVTEVKAEEVEKTVQKAVEEKAVASIAKKAVVAQYLDVSVSLKAAGKTLGTIDKLEEPITITVAIPEELKVENAKYYVLRNHDGEVTLLPTTLNADGTISFTTDQFSTYALAYTKEAVKGSPATGDNSAVMAYTMMAVAAVAVVVVLKKRESFER